MIANNAAQNRVQKARDGAMSAERTRQQGFDAEQAAITDTSRGRYDNFEGQQTDKSTQLGDYFAQQRAAMPNQPGAAVPTSASNITVREGDKQKAKTAAFGQQQDTALGNLRSFGDLLGGVTREQARDTGQIGEIGSFRRGSQAVLPLELNAANHKGDSLKTLGTVLSTAGSVMSMGAGMAGGAGGLFGSAATGPSQLGGVASQFGVGPFSYLPSIPGVAGSAVYSIPIP
jgi:hypothetical protein